MARIVLTAVLVVLLNVLVGCNEANSGRGQLVPKGSREKLVSVSYSNAIEADLIEQMAINRQAYRQGILALLKYYTDTGNNQKLEWVRKELHELDTMAQYNYIIEAGIAGPNLKATSVIPEADALYAEAVALEKDGKKLIIIKDNEKLRLALEKYNQVIRKHPTSDKIDDAAYKAAGLYNHFKDYSIALVYYQRTYQWDKDTMYPARFKAAMILDKRMHRRGEALGLYQESIKHEGQYQRYKYLKEYAEERIAEITQSDNDDDK